MHFFFKWKSFLKIALSILQIYHDKFNHALSKDKICKECIGFTWKMHFLKKYILHKICNKMMNIIMRYIYLSINLWNSFISYFHQVVANILRFMFKNAHNAKFNYLSVQLEWIEWSLVLWQFLFYNEHVFISNFAPICLWW